MCVCVFYAIFMNVFCIIFLRKEKQRNVNNAPEIWKIINRRFSRIGRKFGKKVESRIIHGGINNVRVGGDLLFRFVTP